MKIKSIKIKNFKRFNNLTINGLEHAKLVLVVGTNGSGKSSLLEACNYWYKGNCGHGWFGDDSYYKKLKDKPFNYNDDIGIEFNTSNQAIIKHKRAMYFRTAYRNDPDFNISNFNKVGIPYEQNRIDKIIQNDQTVSQNFQRLISETLKGIYSESNDEKGVKDLREELIGRIKTSMNNVFDDLMLNNLGDPLSEGSFYFKKGVVDSFHYKNLSGGEKSAFDLLLDLILKIQHYDNTVFFIDEPETHMHTSLQGKLVEEMYFIIPDNCQLWLTTHSLGVMQSARKLLKEEPNSVAILDFSGYDFDEATIMEPTKVDKVIWEKFLTIALDEFSELIAPEYIVLCEGNLNGRKRKDFDASIYNKIFSNEHPNITFISGGSSNDLEKEDHMGHALLAHTLKKTKIVKLLDRDDKSAEEVDELIESNIIVLDRRHLESYLFDDEVLTKFCEQQNVIEKIDSILEKKVEILKKSHEEQSKPLDDIKSSSGLIYNMLKAELSLTQCGNNADSFMRDTLAPLVSKDMTIYQELKTNIIDKLLSE